MALELSLNTLIHIIFCHYIQMDLNLPSGQAILSLEGAEFDHVSEIVANVESDPFRNVHVDMEELILSVHTAWHTIFVNLSVTGMALVGAGVVVDVLQERTVWVVLAAVGQVGGQPLAVDPVLVADGHSREV